MNLTGFAKDTFQTVAAGAQAVYASPHFLPVLAVITAALAFYILLCLIRALYMAISYSNQQKAHTEKKSEGISFWPIFSAVFSLNIFQTWKAVDALNRTRDEAETRSKAAETALTAATKARDDAKAKFETAQNTLNLVIATPEVKEAAQEAQDTAKKDLDAAQKAVEKAKEKSTSASAAYQQAVTLAPAKGANAATTATTETPADAATTATPAPEAATAAVKPGMSA